MGFKISVHNIPAGAFYFEFKYIFWRVSEDQALNDISYGEMMPCCGVYVEFRNRFCQDEGL